MNTEDSEFERIEREAQRRAQAAEDDDTQVYTSETVYAKAYRCGYEAGAAAEREACAIRQEQQGATMTDLRQAAQQALECIKKLNMRGWVLADFEDEVYAAITALEAALEQQAQRPWVGLTDEEQIQVAFASGCMSADWLDFAQAIESKLKERNNG